MKWFRKATRYESEIAPRARFLWLTTLSYNDDGTVINKGLVMNTPFKRWMKHINPWSLGPDEGWCTLTLVAYYSYRNKRFVFFKLWEPLRTEDWL